MNSPVDVMNATWEDPASRQNDETETKHDAVPATMRKRGARALAATASLILALGLASLAGCASQSEQSGSSASASASESAPESTGVSTDTAANAPETTSSDTSSESIAPSDASADNGTPSDAAAPPNGVAPPSFSQQAPTGEPPAKPNGENPGDTPAKPDGEPQGDEGVPPAMPDDAGSPGGPGGADPMTYDYKGEYAGEAVADGSEEDYVDESVSATEPGRNAGLAIHGGTLRVFGGIYEKSGDDDNGDRCNFYGANSIILSANESSKAIVADAALKATSKGSNGLFATDSATVFANGTSIETTADNSRGLDATYGGTIVASNLTVTTLGDHCAAVATDRGGGTISLASSSLSTAGSGSPVLYSTGDIEVDNVTGTATGSQLVGMEGLNSVIISNSNLSSTQTGKTASDPIADGVIIYQSTSGDAEAKTGEAALLQVTDSTLASAIESGALFYLTNTNADVIVSNTDLDFDSEAANLIVASGNDANNWGKAGANGVTASFTGMGQSLAGDIEVDTISTVDFFLLDGSTWEGSSKITENAAATTAKDHLNVNIDSTSAWIVTEDATVTNLNIAPGGKLVDGKKKTVNVADADGNVLVDGVSDITVTVAGGFSTTVPTSASNKLRPASANRSAFDEAFGIVTTFGQNGSAASGAADEAEHKALAAKQAVLDWFHNLG